MSMLKRLLGSLHSAVFDTSPDSGLAFFVRHPDGITWTVSDESLTATINGVSKTYQLSTMTVGQLAGQFVLDGMEVTGLQPEFSGLSASVLLDGSGNTLDTNGDRLFAFRDLLRSLFGGYARELRTAKYQVGEAIKQMVITQAESEWLDLWGALYNTPRKNGMADVDYAQLIPQEAFRLRVNGYAIEKAILDLTGQRVHIEEPWGDMFRLDYSKLSGTSKFYDGSTIGYHLIRPVADKAINWDGILDIIERNKAAGVIVLPPEERNRIYVNDPLAGNILFQHWMIMARLIQYSFIPRLDDTLVLSNYDMERNYLTAITSLQMLSSLVDEVNGIMMPASPSHILGYGPAVYPQDSQVFRNYTGYFGPEVVMAYPTDMKTWRGSGKWTGGKTWEKPYIWRVFSRATSYSSTSFTDATIDGTALFAMSTGADWTVPDSWNDMTWNGDADYLQTWDNEPTWGTNDWTL
ncbi:hypothetical protein [Pseudomonas sp.]|uniref:hypothetical protein n=1 Tax=Pseudomonas sp. TaxID=306 RepID=UPI00258A4970|nr:hypothetical protein [Pseudomonas sp.]